MADCETEDALAHSFLADLPAEMISELRADGERADYPLANLSLESARSRHQPPRAGKCRAAVSSPGHTRCVIASAPGAPITPRLRCGIVLRAEEEACQVLADGQVVSVRYTPQFPAPRRARVLPGHLVAVAEAPGATAVVVWRWYDAVVLSSDAGSVRLWEPAHGEVAAHRRRPQQQYDPGTRAYLSAGLPGAEWWVAGRAADRAEDAEVELDEVERLYTEHGMWDSAFGR